MATVKYDQYVTTPDVLVAISTLLGTSIKDVKTLYQSTKINKWAIYKPQSPTAHQTVAMLTLAERQADNMGLNMNSIPELVDEGTGIASATLADVRASIAEWGYKSRTQPYRLHDFLNDENVESSGYNHLAKPCDDGWSNSGVRKTSSVPDILVSNFNMRIGESSAESINASDTNHMPIKYINDDLSSWYIGLAIYIEDIGGVAGRDGWMFVRGAKPLSYADETNFDVQKLFPNLTTNEWLRDEIQDALDDGITTFTYVPCILKNPNDKVITEDAQRTYISMYGEGRDIICMPSGAKDYSIIFNVAIANIHVTTSSGGIGYKLTGYTIQFTGEKVTALYMIKGYVNTAGKTTGGWFLANPTKAYAGSGFYVRQFVVVFATVPDSGNELAIGTPTSSQSLDMDRWVYYSYFSEISSQGAKVAYNTFEITASLSASGQVTFGGYYGDTTFYGHNTNLTELGLSLEYALKDAY